MSITTQNAVGPAATFIPAIVPTVVTVVGPVTSVPAASKNQSFNVTTLLAPTSQAASNVSPFGATASSGTIVVRTDFS
jgi:hypothetical protein